MVTVSAVTATVKALQAALLVLTALQLTGYKWPQSATINSGTHYDVIIVGAGTAGSIIANRLTEVPGLSVLLIEEGGDPPLEAVLPGTFPFLYNTTYEYNITAENDGVASLNVNNGRQPLTVGRVLGGSSTLHHMMHVRGNPRDFDFWAEAAGDDSWRFDTMIRYFMKSEKIEDEEILASPGSFFQGRNGPLRASRQKSKENEVVLKALSEIGYETVINVNDPNFTLGATEPLLQIANGYRHTVAEGYLRPLADRPNFHLLKNTKVLKVLFNGNTAVGVEAVQVTAAEERSLIFYANREVIVSAGAILSPQLLMLSGIGPKEHLSSGSLNISVVADLPVGKNLIDHMGLVLMHALEESDPVTTPQNPHEFPLPSTISFSALNKSQLYPDYHSINLVFPADTDALIQILSPVFAYDDDISQQVFDKVKGRKSFFSLLYGVNPVSRGEVLLRSNNPHDLPRVRHGMFSDDRDVVEMANILADFKRIVNTPTFRSLGANYIDMDLPACNGLDKDSLEYRKCYVLNMSTSSWHYVGTCAMGSVVDNRLRVKGVNNLRVIDGSVIPRSPRAKVHAPIVALAERGADIIKEDLGSSPRLV